MDGATCLLQVFICLSSGGHLRPFQQVFCLMLYPRRGHGQMLSSDCGDSENRSDSKFGLRHREDR
jgi:hypothetical protein